MKKIIRIACVVFAIAMVFAMAACGSKESGKKPEQTSPDINDSVLKGVYDAFLKNESYNQIKNAYENTTFEEKVSDDGITVKVSGTDGVEGEYTFPAKDGYLICNVTGNDFLEPSIFTMLVGGVAEYYDIDSALFNGYLNGLANNGIESKCYSVTQNDDGSGTMQIYYAEKPEMSELDDLYINATALADYEDETITNFIMLFGKLSVNCVIDRNAKAINFAIGEYGDKNTDLTYKSIMEIVNFFKPDGYEDFARDYTELAEVSTDKYTVTSDSTDYIKEHETELIDGYTFMFVTFDSAYAE